MGNRPEPPPTDGREAKPSAPPPKASRNKIQLTIDDPRVQRIASALSEGCDARAFASNDAKWLAHRYYEHRCNPKLSFQKCRNTAFAEFIVGVLNGAL